MRNFWKGFVIVIRKSRGKIDFQLRLSHFATLLEFHHLIQVCTTTYFLQHFSGWGKGRSGCSPGTPLILIIIINNNNINRWFFLSFLHRLCGYTMLYKMRLVLLSSLIRSVISLVIVSQDIIFYILIVSHSCLGICLTNLYALRPFLSFALENFFSFLGWHGSFDYTDNF